MDVKEDVQKVVKSEKAYEKWHLSVQRENDRLSKNVEEDWLSTAIWAWMASRMEMFRRKNACILSLSCQWIFYEEVLEKNAEDR